MRIQFVQITCSESMAIGISDSDSSASVYGLDREGRVWKLVEELRRDEKNKPMKDEKDKYIIDISWKPLPFADSSQIPSSKK